MLTYHPLIHATRGGKNLTKQHEKEVI